MRTQKKSVLHRELADHTLQIGDLGFRGVGVAISLEGAIAVLSPPGVVQGVVLFAPGNDHPGADLVLSGGLSGRFARFDLAEYLDLEVP